MPALALLLWTGVTQARNGDIQLQDRAALARAYQGNWVFLLPDIIEAVRKCAEHGRFVSGALLQAGERMVARVDGSGEPVFCFTAYSGQDLDIQTEAAEPGLPAESAFAFFLDRQCADAARVLMGARIVGWLAYPACGKPD